MVALDSLGAYDVARREMHENVRRSIFYPILILVLTYGAVIWLCVVTVPKFEALYQQVGHSPDVAVTLMVLCRNSIPVWGPAFPLLVIVGWFWWRRRSHRWSWLLLPGSRGYFSAVEHAEMARRMAPLLQSGLSPQDSLALVRFKRDESQTESIDRLPPLLDWAVHGDLGNESRSGLMAAVAQSYQRLARQRSRRWLYFAGAVIGVFVGGGFVFSYGFLLFLATRNLLIDISIPGGS